MREHTSGQLKNNLLITLCCTSISLSLLLSTGCARHSTDAGSTAAASTTTASATTPVIQPAPELPLACRKEVFIPASLTTQKLTVRTLEGAPDFVNTPALMEWGKKRIQIAPARHETETVPAQYREVIETVEVARERVEVIGYPATYITKQKPITLVEPHRRWKTGCIATDINQCIEQVPLKSVTISQKIIDLPARSVQKRVPGKTITIKRKVLVKPGKGHGRIIPAQYQDVKVSKVAKSWQIHSHFKPSEYQNFTLTMNDRPSTIRELPVVCQDKLPAAKVRLLQQRLINAGYALRPHGKLDQDTLRGLLNYQQENNLPQGGITLETLRKLGLA